MRKDWMHEVKRRRRIRQFFTFVIVTIIVGALLYIPFASYNKLEVIENVKVISTSSVLNINGDKDNTYTSYTYYVNTDKGVFEISPDGLFASKVFGTLKNDSIYTITTRGFNFPSLGFHLHIIDAQ